MKLGGTLGNVPQKFVPQNIVPLGNPGDHSNLIKLL
jgi:hypothetical protein